MSDTMLSILPVFNAIDISKQEFLVQVI